MLSLTSIHQGNSLNRVSTWDAVIAAHNRDVTVRVVADDHAYNAGCSRQARFSLSHVKKQHTLYRASSWNDTLSQPVVSSAQGESVTRQTLNASQYVSNPSG